jgi:para-aminobenzoate synthetase component 1
MRTRLLRVPTAHTARSLAGRVRGRGGLTLLESTLPVPHQGRYSIVAVEPMVTFRATGPRLESRGGTKVSVEQGDPWARIERWLERFDLTTEADLPFPAGGCFGYWGYELRQFVEPKLHPHPVADLPLPDCWLGFHDSLVVFDQERDEAWIVATGFEPDGRRSVRRADERVAFWQEMLAAPPTPEPSRATVPGVKRALPAIAQTDTDGPRRAAFLEQVRQAQRYIRQGDIYQVNLSQRWFVPGGPEVWKLHAALAARSPAPFAAYLEGEDFALTSASPELFLKFDGNQVMTRPIKGTRPRGDTPSEDGALAAALQASPKEQAELLMITDLLRNDLGRVCRYGSVQVPELQRLESYAQVQHLVATVTGELRPEISQARALAACFPGGSVTGAPKFRAMQLIDELEPVGRGPYTGCLGYLGFNRRSQLSIIIRAAFGGLQGLWYYAGAGIVADSEPAAEYAETLAKVSALREILDTEAAACAHWGAVTPHGVTNEGAGS